MLDLMALETAVVLVIVLTAALPLLGTWYNNKIVEGVFGDVRPITSLVAFGVVITETIRGLRIAVIVFALLGPWPALLALGCWTFESLSAWGPIGLPLMQGESQRAKRRREEAEAPVREQVQALADEARQAGR